MNFISTVNGSIILYASFIALSIGCSLLLAWPVMYLWNNCLILAIPGINSVDWIHAWGILILCCMLFKSDVNAK